MTKLLLSVSALFILASCVVKDKTVAPASSLPQFSQPDTGLNKGLYIDSAKGPLGSLYYSDTLIFFAQFSECGEFGGHREWLKIYNGPDNKFRCQTIVDSVSCSTDTKNISHTRVDSSIYVMSESAQNAVVDYLLELTRLSFAYQEPMYNAGNVFTAEIRKTYVWDHSSGYEVGWYDGTFQWNRFLVLKQEIITTADDG